MTDSVLFLNSLQEQGINYFTGVPDSLMKGFLTKLQGHPNHFIAANEGAAVAMAAGYHLSTSQIGLVYLQNSGLGNMVNPLTSLVNPEVYGIPVLLMIGWRGEPGIKDEPQHQKMGAITLSMLDLLDIPYHILDDASWSDQLKLAIKQCREKQSPVALVIRSGFFGDTDDLITENYPLSASDVMEHIYPMLSHNDVVIATTGKLGRFFYEINSKNNNRINTFFMNVGAMGHAGALAASIAKFSSRRIVLLDGDGSLLMHMGSLAVSGTMPLNDFQYLLLNNAAHQSVGGQETVGFKIDFCGIARAVGFAARLVTNEEELSALDLSFAGKQFIEIRINSKMPLQLPRPKESFSTGRDGFMKNINS